MSLVEQVARKLIDNNITISSAESLTAGMFGSILAGVPGISKVYKGSIVSYSTEVKESILGIPKTIIDKHGVVSSSVAYLMAQNVASLLKTRIAVSFTGNAGPDAMEGKKVGLVYIGITYDHITEAHEFHFAGTRLEIRNACVEEALKLILLKIDSIK